MKEKTKKTTKKVAKRITKKPTKKEDKKEFNLFISLNDNEFTFETNDIKESILSVRPEFLKTRVVVKVTKGNKTIERVLFLKQGKMLFNNKYTIDAFIKNLLF